MHDLENIKIPEIVQEILVKTEDIGFQMVSEPSCWIIAKNFGNE